MQEVAGDHVRAEGRRFLLKYDGNDVIANVPFALQLLRIAGAIRQQRGHMEQHFPAPKHFIHRRIAGLSVSSIQSTAITAIFSELENNIEKK